jgi:translation initiation factor 1
VKPKHTFRGVVLHDAPRTTATAMGLNARERAAPGPARVRVGREVAGRGGKGVSVITGLPLPAEGLAELATRLKKLCGAGGAVKHGVIEIQGDHRERLVAELIKLGYAAKQSGG